MKKNVNVWELLAEIELELKKKSLKPSGFNPLKAPSKFYLASYLYAINHEHDFFKDPKEEIKRDIP